MASSFGLVKRPDPPDAGGRVPSVARQPRASLPATIASLPVPYREAVVLCDLEGQTYEEAAAVQGCAVGTVRSRLHRARELLARKFQHTREGIRCG